MSDEVQPGDPMLQDPSRNQDVEEDDRIGVPPEDTPFYYNDERLGEFGNYWYNEEAGEGGSEYKPFQFPEEESNSTHDSQDDRPTKEQCRSTLKKAKERHDLIDQYLRLKADLRHEEKKNAYLQDRIYRNSIRKGLMNEGKMRKEDTQVKQRTDLIKALLKNKFMDLRAAKREHRRKLIERGLYEGKDGVPLPEGMRKAMKERRRIWKQKRRVLKRARKLTRQRKREWDRIEKIKRKKEKKRRKKLLKKARKIVEKTKKERELESGEVKEEEMILKKKKHKRKRSKKSSKDEGSKKDQRTKIVDGKLIPLGETYEKVTEDGQTLICHQERKPRDPDKDETSHQRTLSNKSKKRHLSPKSEQKAEKRKQRAAKRKAAADVKRREKLERRKGKQRKKDERRRKKLRDKESKAKMKKRQKQRLSQSSGRQLNALDDESLDDLSYLTSQDRKPKIPQVDGYGKLGDRLNMEIKYEYLVSLVVAHLRTEKRYKFEHSNNLLRQIRKRDLWKKAHEKLLEELLDGIRYYSTEAVDSNTGCRIPRSDTEQFCKDIALLHSKLCATMVSMFKTQRGLEVSMKRLEATEIQGEGLQMMEYEQMKSENKSLQDRLQDRTKDVENIKEKIAEAVQILAHFRNKMFSMNQKIMEGKILLNKVNTEVHAARAKAERIMKKHDQIKKEEQGLIVESGLLENSSLLRDFEKTHFYILDLKEQKRKLLSDLDEYKKEIVEVRRRMDEMKEYYPEIYAHQEELEKVRMMEAKKQSSRFKKCVPPPPSIKPSKPSVKGPERSSLDTPDIKVASSIRKIRAEMPEDE